MKLKVAQACSVLPPKNPNTILAPKQLWDKNYCDARIQRNICFKLWVTLFKYICCFTVPVSAVENISPTLTAFDLPSNRYPLARKL